MGPLQKSMISYAQPCGGDILPKLCLEVKRQLISTSNQRGQKNFLLGHIRRLMTRRTFNPCDCEKYCKRDTQGPVRQALGLHKLYIVIHFISKECIFEICRIHKRKLNILCVSPILYYDVSNNFVKNDIY